MDYLGWELERQRAALAALLLGGGETRDHVRDGARRSGAGTPESRAGNSEEALGAWKADLGGAAAREAGEGRAAGRAGTAGTPLSAWEAVLGGAADVPPRTGEGAWTLLRGEAGAQAEFLRSPGGYAARRGMRRTEAGLTAGAQSLSAVSAGDGMGDGAAPLEAGPGLDGAAGDTAAGHPGLPLRVRWGGQRTADTLGRDGPPAVSQVAQEAAMTGPWGGREAAALRAEDSAKLLSRAVQRDARRYDGGFNIY